MTYDIILKFNTALSQNIRKIVSIFNEKNLHVKHAVSQITMVYTSELI